MLQYHLVLIEKYASKKWTSYEARQSISAIEDLIAGDESGGSLHFEASNLILLLHENVYEDYSCIGVDGKISRSAFAEIQNAVRTRVLELTIQLEKSIPSATEITLGRPAAEPGDNDTETVTQITQNIVHGNVTAISNTGQGAKFNLSIGERDGASFVKALVDAGITERDAKQLEEIVASEEAESQEEPFGAKAKAWIAKNLNKAADGTWKMGLAVATQVLTEAAMRYYGFKQ